MDDLVVDSKFTTAVVDDQDANASTTIGKGVVESRPQATLVNDRETLLDIASLSHGHNSSVVADVKHTVLLEHRTEHVLDNDRRRRVGDEAGLFMKLLGEEIHAEVAVLTGLSRSGDADNLARTALEDQEITDANVVAGNSDRMGRHVAFDDTNVLADTLTDAGGSAFLVNDDVLAVMVVVVVMTVEGVEDPIGGFFNAVAEGVIVAFVVVVAHFGFISGRSDVGFGFDLDFVSGVSGGSLIVFYVVGWMDASAVFTLSDVDFFLTAGDFDVDLGLRVALVWFAVSDGSMSSVLTQTQCIIQHECN